MGWFLACNFYGQKGTMHNLQKLAHTFLLIL